MFFSVFIYFNEELDQVLSKDRFQLYVSSPFLVVSVMS